MRNSSRGWRAIVLLQIGVLAFATAWSVDVHAATEHRLYFAEGAKGIFETQYAIANPDPSHEVRATLHFLNDDGREVIQPLRVPPRGRVTVDAGAVPGVADAFGLEIRGDGLLAAERSMRWYGGGFGSHGERAVEAPATMWYFAEGATTAAFDVFYLVMNPTTTEVTVTGTYLRPEPLSPLVRTYTVAPRSRLTIWARQQAPELQAAEFSAVFEATAPIVAERAQYTVVDGQLRGGHAAAGITTLSADWYFAEGATGSFFDTFFLLANPSAFAADVAVTFLLPDGSQVERGYDVAPHSRLTVWADHADPALADTAVSTRIHVRNGIPIAAERAMWWPFDSTTWREGHVSAGATVTAERWVVAGGESETPRGDDTFVLLTNLSAQPASVRVTLGYDDDEPASERVLTLAAGSRTNVWPGVEFPESLGRSFAVFVEALGADPVPLIVESSVYGRDGDIWSAGRSALATPVPAPLSAATTSTVGVGDALLISTASGPLAVTQEVAVRVADAALVDATVDPASGDVLVTPRGNVSGTTTIVVAVIENGNVLGTRTHTIQVVGGPIRFGTTQQVDLRLFPDFQMAPDGRAAPFGSVHGPDGLLTGVDLPTIGLYTPWHAAYSSILRETRIADFNGDGVADLLAVHYRAVDDLAYEARLFFGRADGTFIEDPMFRAQGFRGYAHTVLTADFDNDGDLDVFIPSYGHYHPDARNFLLRNDGAGRFDEVADAAGVAMRGWPFELKVEGAQAVDFDDDGWIDFYVGSQLFRNEGNFTFTPIQHALGMFDDMATDGLFDEGMRFFDWNNDGRLDLVLHHPHTGPRLLEFDGQRFHWRQVFLPQDPEDLYFNSYGMNVYDLNGDGLEDMVLAGGVEGETVVMKHTGSGFVREPSEADGWRGDAIAFGDIDGDGRIDLFSRRAVLVPPDVADSAYAFNATPRIASDAFVRLDIVGERGEPNQAGRVVRISPLDRPDIVYTRIVDGGSSLMSKNQYELLVPLPLPGPHLVRVRFDHGEVQLVVNRGERVRVFRSGQVERR